MHPLLRHIQSALDDPDVSTASALKANGWHKPLWFTGSMTEFADGRVIIQVKASTIEGSDTPVLFLHLDEAQARRHASGSPLIQQPLGVVGLLTQQQVIDLSIVHGGDVVTMTHSQFMILHDSMALLNPAARRNDAADARYVERLTAFMHQAREFGQGQPDIRSLHLAALMPGAAPMRCVLLLDASNAAVHENELQALHSASMTPGDALLLFDPLDLSEVNRSIIELLRQQEPVYRKPIQSGWWTRLKGRWTPPRLVIIDLNLDDTTEATCTP